MADPDYEITPSKGEASRVTLQSRARPWLIRIAGYDLYVAVEAHEPEPDDGVGPEAEAESSFRDDIDELGPEGNF